LVIYSRFGVLIGLLALLTLGSAYIITFESLPKVFLQIGGLHGVAFLVGLGVLYISLKLKNSFGRDVSEPFIYIMSGVIFLTAIHAFQFLFVVPFEIVQMSMVQQRTIFHLFFYSGFLSFGYAFYIMLRDQKQLAQQNNKPFETVDYY